VVDKRCFEWLHAIIEGGLVAAFLLFGDTFNAGWIAGVCWPM